MNEIIKINNWTLTKTDGEDPKILDVELAEKLGYSKSANVKKLIRRMIEADQLGRVSTAETQQTIGKQTVLSYYLDEHQALKVIARSKTTTADKILDEVIAVFIAYRKGLLQPVDPSTVPPTQSANFDPALISQLVSLSVAATIQALLPHLTRQASQREEPPLDFPIQPRAEYPVYQPQRPLALVTPRRAPQEDEPRFEWLAGVANQLGLSYPQASNIASIYGLFDTTHMRKAQTKSGRMGWMVDGFASAQIEDHARRMGLL